MGRTFCPTTPLLSISHERSSSRSWKERTFSKATLKESSRSAGSDPRACSISSSGTRIDSGRTPSKRSVYSSRASSPRSRTPSTMRRAASRISAERNPPGRRSSATTSSGSLSRASSFLTTEAPPHGVEQGGHLRVAEAVGAAVGDQTGGGVRDLVEDGEVVLTQGGAGRGEVHDALGEADERGELDGAVELDDLRLPAQRLEVAPGGVRELGRHPHDLSVGDGSPHLLSSLLRRGQDHAARPRPEVAELHYVRALFLEHVFTDDPDVGRAVLDEDRDVRGSAHDELRAPHPVEEPASVVAQRLHRQPGLAERRERALEDGPLGHRDAQPAQKSTLPATSPRATSSN